MLCALFVLKFGSFCLFLLQAMDKLEASDVVNTDTGKSERSSVSDHVMFNACPASLLIYVELNQCRRTFNGQQR